MSRNLHGVSMQAWLSSHHEQTCHDSPTAPEHTGKTRLYVTHTKQGKPRGKMTENKQTNEKPTCPTGSLSIAVSPNPPLDPNDPLLLLLAAVLAIPARPRREKQPASSALMVSEVSSLRASFVLRAFTRGCVCLWVRACFRCTKRPSTGLACR